MMEHEHLIVIKGNYQIVALTTEEDYDPEDIVAYAVMTMSGARLQQAQTLDDAKSWMEKLLVTENPPVPLQPERPRRKRVRR